MDTEINALFQYKTVQHAETDIYFYHLDNLGSSSWITDRGETPVQHLAYLPFREEFVDQQISDWSAVHKFSGKEKDAETSYNYFGARYYSSDLGIFIGVDPLSDKYPSLSSYAYCRNNPIILVDPDGMDDEIILTDYRNEKGELLYKTKDGLKTTIIVPDDKVNEFESKLTTLYNENKINDAQANKEELHPLGTDVLKYNNKHKTGNQNIDNGFAVGYDKTYNKKSTKATDELYSTVSFGLEGAQMSAGYGMGKTQGERDRQAGKINMQKPFEGLKNNEPLIEIPKPEPIRKYPGVGLPPK